VAEVGLQSDLCFDLGLDSLGRVELAALIEEQLGAVVSDEVVAAAATVGDLLAAMEEGVPGGPAEALPAWPRRAPAVLARRFIQELLLFPALGVLCRPRRVQGAERLDALDGPVLMVANHTSHLDAPSVLSVLPAGRRRRTVVAAAEDYFFGSALGGATWMVAIGAIPFRRRGNVAASLRHCGELARAGYSILIFPEGTRSPDGWLRAFKPGVGLLARELGLPVVPIHLDGAYGILPKGRGWPRPGPLTVRIGEPIRVSRELSNSEASAALEDAVRRLGSRDVPPEAALEPVRRGGGQAPALRM
jgi:long-chain acyl-CoA synthetase